MPKTYWEGRMPAPNSEAVIGKPCSNGCGRILTADNLSVHTDKAGACNSCVPQGDRSIPPGMLVSS